MCVLRASGEDFDVDAFLEISPWKPAAIHRKGEPKLPKSRPEGDRFEHSGFNLDVSEASWSDLPAQVEDAEAFLREFESELRRLLASPGVEGAVLDFAIESRIASQGVVAQFDQFPASLVALAGAIPLAIELSQYPGDVE